MIKTRSIALLIISSLFTLTFNVRLAFASDGNVYKDASNKTTWTVLGPEGGDVRSVAIDPKNKDRVFISTMDGQIYQSEDAGKSWKMIAKFGIPMLFLDQLIIDSQNSNVIFASGHRGKLPGGFFKSSDGGRTWKESKELRGEAIHAMAQAPSDPKTIFVGTKRGVFVSHDSGDSWEKIESDTMPVDINSMAIDPRSTSVIYAGTNWRPYKSTDNGKSWRLIKDGMIDDSDVFAITIDNRNYEHIVASACSGIYESFNGGETWKKIQGIPSQSRRTRDIVQHPTMPGTIYAATTEGFWMTTDGGKSWKLTTSRFLEINSIAVHPDAPNRVFIGTNNYGLLVSNDGGRSFAPTNNSFTSRFAFNVVVDNEHPDRLYATTLNTASSGGFFFYSDNYGRTWNQAKGLDVNHVTPLTLLQDKLNPNLIYLGTNRGLYRSLDRGVSWTEVSAPKKKPVRGKTRTRATATKKQATSAKKSTTAKTTAKGSAQQPEEAKPALIAELKMPIRTLAFSADDKAEIFAGTDDGLYRSKSLDQGWEKVNFGDEIKDAVFAIFSNPQVPGTIWVGTSRNGVLVSEDNGKTWRKTKATPDGVPVNVITSDPTRPNYMYVGTIQAFYLSRDGGRNWTRRGGNLPLGNFTSILINPKNPDMLIISSALENDGGIFISEDAGMKWKRLDSKDLTLPSRRVWSLVFDPTNSGRVFAGTHSSGIYAIELPTGEAEQAKSEAN
ncbi:MAG TPA: YCF48-related protein [Pyrinomonadaceae bacterium]|nr:YCF48-related protein [Pyrinomonadaceae bacterium]